MTPAAESVSATGASVSVLVVDDNAAQRLALNAILGTLDVTLVEAESGRHALRCLLQQEFAVILLDVNMPGLDGFETAALIRERRSSEHTPIIFVTAHGDDAYAARGYSLGAVDYILAPVQPNVLRAKVSVFIDLYRKTAQVRQQREALWRYAAQLQQLSEASLAIYSATAFDDLLRAVAHSARRIIGARQASATAAMQEDGHYLTVTLGPEDGAERRSRTGSERRLTIEGPQRMTQAELENLEPLHLRPTELAAGMALRGWLAAPLAARDGRPLGLIQLSDKRDGEFTAEDERVLMQLARMASVTIDNAVAAEAREANRLKDDFLGVLSHELRTPLQAMLAWTEILRSKPPEPALLARGLEVIERGTRAQVQLIGDLLDVSRIIRGQLRIDSSVVDLVRVVEQAIETLKPAAAKKRIAIAWVPPVSDCRVLGDAARLQQVVWNLLSNAIKFTPDEGRVEVALTVEAGRVLIQVRDTGSGIPPEFLPHAFERFRQADSSAARPHGGLGLGLAIVRHLVEMHGGSVQARNRTDATGAVFSVFLPRPAAAPLGNGASAASKPVDGAGRLEGIRVLLVEDERQARESVTTYLEMLGAEVMAVNSAAAAMSALEFGIPDVLLSDIGMPEEDGYTLIRRVRTWESAHGSRIPAAALTAYVRADDRAAALNAGFDTHLAKPVEPAELAKVVRRLAHGAEH